MGVSLRRLRGSPVLRGAGANIYVQIVRAIGQLVSVPILIKYWGVDTYGLWLLLFSVPGYLVVADFGLAQAATAEMLAHVAKGRRADAVATYRAVRILVLAINAACLLLAAVLAFGLLSGVLAPYDERAGGSVALVLMILTLYGTITIQNGVTSSGYIATGGYALNSYIIGTMYLAETVASWIVVGLGGSIVHAALSYLVVRGVTSVIMMIGLRRRAPWLAEGGWSASPTHIRRLLRPAAALVALTGGQAATIEGGTMVVGLANGAMAVPVFTTARTLTRVALQAVLVVNRAMMPSFSIANATDGRARMKRFALISVALSLACSLPIMAGAALFGPELISLWTHGHVRPDLTFLMLMALSMALNSLWLPLSNLLTSINRQAGFAYFFLFASLAGLGLCLLLSRPFGLTGVAIAMVAVDFVMLVWVSRLIGSLGIIHLRDFRDAFSALRQLLAGRLRR
ncbi:Membrane protein involved in the export of O-antigen and teichoic acid [Pseudoxanthobacter soli DSM 19599]|uniref:Membrane protein involved in the export of O-antigen and teichoic acid n=1 Tax=Pseudoxanthobacter soli DSM 19599 TaxID=1123029 RepID=A0A1M7ZPR8_9HYPH|nr:polysaccharide biosynthesis C-terminal domain-containing protein [Pseudoxanthobacter soli]SHO66867.1 Membrane protein involved in the export of O-antigen and teichoic acid [Pseudoxanthobacter soli DSM 19599]